MKPELAKLYRDVQDLHRKHYAMVEKLREEITKTTDLKELADTAYCFHKAIELAEDMSKEFKKTEELAGKLAVLVHTKLVQGGMKDEPIRTDFCTATPDCTMMIMLPKKRSEPEQYDALMAHMLPGVPREVWDTPDGEAEQLRVHWPGFQARVNRDLASGKPAPPGINMSRSVPQFKLKFSRSKKEPGD